MSALYAVNPPFQQVNYVSVFRIPLWSDWDAPQSSKQRQNKYVIFQSTIPCLVLSEFHAWKSVRLMAQAPFICKHLLQQQNKSLLHTDPWQHIFKLQRLQMAGPLSPWSVWQPLQQRGKSVMGLFMAHISSRNSTGSLKLSQRSVLPNIIMHCCSKNSSD